MKSFLRYQGVLLIALLLAAALPARAALDGTRWVSFEAGESWVVGAAPNYNGYNTSGWTGTMLRVANFGALINTLNNTTNGAWLRVGTNSLGQTAYLRSPVLPVGVGTIYFEAGVRTTSPTTWYANFVVQVLTNGGTWTTYYSNTVSGAAILYPVIPVNLRVPSQVQIQITGWNPIDLAQSGNLVLDNVVVSPPPTDVLITESLHNPGYPSSEDPTYVRCQTTDYDPVNAPSTSQALSVSYAYMTAGGLSPWSTTNMYITTNANSYETIIPACPAGSTTYYYFKSLFSGYAYSNNITTNAGTAYYKSEGISPSYLPDLRTGPVLALYPSPAQLTARGTPSSLSYNNRAFRSDLGSMILQTTPTNLTASMSLVGDYIWQGLILMQGVTNLPWFFVGNGLYTSNALSFSTNAISWGDTNQDFSNPPLGGTAELTSDPQYALQANLNYSGFLVFRLATTNLNYLVRRAVYQDFNVWPADPTHFTQSMGLYAIQTYTNNFATWGTNLFDASTWRTNGFLTDPLNAPLTDAYTPTIGAALNYYWYQEASIVGERQLSATAAANRALLLNNASAALGNVGNQPPYAVIPNGMTYGVHNFAFNARLAQADNNYAVYTSDLSFLTNGSPWVSGYRVTNTFRASSLSLGTNASISLLLCYRLPGPNLGNFYELRLTQNSDNSGNDSNVRLDLFRWNNGVITKTIGTLSNAPALQLTNANGIQVDLTWATTAGPAVVFNGSVSVTNGTFFTLTTNVFVDSDASRLSTGGTVGFLCSDAEAQVRALGVNSGANPVAFTNYNASGSSNYWYLGGTRSDGNAWWQTNALGYLTRTNVPSKLVLYVARAATPTTWTSNATITVSSYNYASSVIGLNLWDSAFVRLQSSPADQPVVVDNLSLDPWRGYTRGSADYNMNPSIIATVNNVVFWNWTSPSQQYTWSQNGTTADGVMGWIITEGLIVNTPGLGNYASFDTSRANPALAQGLWSPYLTNGLGLLSFNAWVDSGTNVYKVQATDINNPALFVDVQNATFTDTVFSASSSNPVNRVVAVQTAHLNGRIRVVQTSGSSTGAVLNINNLVALNYPPPDATTWMAYNCMVTSSSGNTNTTSLTFQSSAGPGDPQQTCYMNNSPTNNVLVTLGADNPYIQTPQIDTGIGEISFWYRAFTNTAPAYVSIQLAPNGNGPWTIVTNFSATNMTYQFFDMPNLFDLDNHAVRIYTQTNTPATTPPTNNAGRLCIDNVLVTEPVRAGFEIVSASLLPGQPLWPDKVGVQATIGRYLMNPQGIRVFLSYVVGTNNWGVKNWWGTGSTPNPGVPMLELTNIADKTYATPSGSFIPANAIDTVIQYVVWGTNADMVGKPYFQGTNAFTNPSWYTPVDLNVAKAASGWSPYYFVYSCPPGSVWINEFNYYDYSTDADITNEYVELIGPAGANLGNWLIELQYYDLSLITNCTITSSLTLTNTSNTGWGFFVWGDVGVPRVNQTFSDSGPYSVTIPSYGAWRLTRSMGAWESRVSWVFSQTGYTFIQNAKNGYTLSPLALQGPLPGHLGTRASDFEWNQPSDGNYTPGLPNTDQKLGPADPILPKNQDFFTLTLGISSHGSQSVVSGVQVANGTSTQVVYTADSWFRISSFVSNGATNTPAIGLSQYTWSSGIMSQAISNNVAFDYATPQQTGYPTNIPTAWLSQWGFGEADLSNHWGNGALSLTQEYWFDVNPTASNSLVFNTTAFGASNSMVSALVHLLVNSNKINYLNGGATLRIMSKTNLTDASIFAVYDTNVSASTFDANGFWQVGGPVTNPHQFFRPEIDNTPSGWSPGP